MPARTYWKYFHLCVQAAGVLSMALRGRIHTKLDHASASGIFCPTCCPHSCCSKKLLKERRLDGMTNLGPTALIERRDGPAMR